LDRVFGSCEHALADQDLAGGGLRAQSRCQVRDRPECPVVIAALEADPAECGVSGLDPNSQTQLNSSPPPLLCQFGDGLPRSKREADGFKFVLLNGDGVVEEDHDAVSSEMLQRAPMLFNQASQIRVVVAKHLEKLLRCRGLGECSEAAQVAEEAGDIGAMTGKQALAVTAGEEIRDLRGERKRANSRRCRSTASVRRAL
jgi:hypothetical protein